MLLSCCIRRVVSFCIFLLAGGLTAAHAQLTIVALGASNTSGHGLFQSQAYPAQLEALLKARGVNARVINAGVSGQNSDHLLARLDSAVPKGTRLVILEAWTKSDIRQGIGAKHTANVELLKSRIRGKGAAVIDIEHVMIHYFSVRGRDIRIADGRHFNEEGYALVAKHILPQVLSAIGR